MFLLLFLSNLAVNLTAKISYWNMPTRNEENHVLVWTKCVPAIFTCESPNPQCDARERWGLCEVIRVPRGLKGGALINGVGALIRTGGDQSSLFLPCEDTGRSLLWARDLEPGSESADPSMLDFPAAGTVRSEHSLLKSFSLWHFVKAAGTD